MNFEDGIEVDDEERDDELAEMIWGNVDPGSGDEGSLVDSVDDDDEGEFSDAEVRAAGFDDLEDDDLLEEGGGSGEDEDQYEYDTFLVADDDEEDGEESEIVSSHPALALAEAMLTLLPSCFRRTIRPLAPCCSLAVPLSL